MMLHRVLTGLPNESSFGRARFHSTSTTATTHRGSSAIRALLHGSGTGSSSSNIGILSTSDESKFRHEMANSSSESLSLRKYREYISAIGYLILIRTQSPLPGRVKNVQINDPKEVTYLTAANRKAHNFKDDRVIVTSGKAPFFLFSILPYHKSKETRKEARRRNTSGGRPLSAINDGSAFDPFDLLGVPKADAGQEISYGYLLVPSKPYTKEKKHTGTCAVIPETNLEISNFHALKNHAVAR